MSRLLPLILPLLGGFWALGWFRKQARKSVFTMGNTAVGVVGFWAALTWLYKNRRDAISVVAAAVLAAAVIGFGAVWWMAPEWRLTITLPVALAGLVGYLAWDYEHTKGAPLAEVIAGKREEVRVRNAVHQTHENAHVRSAKRTADGWSLAVDHVGQLDPALVGQAVQVGDARAVPSDKMGRSTLVLEGRVGGWERFAKPVEWNGPKARKATDALVFGVDGSGSPVSLPFPGIGGLHALCAGSTGAGKSGLVRVLIAELAHCPDVDLVLCDPKRVEFRGWAQRAFVAAGEDASGKAFDAVYEEMMRRYEEMPEDQVEWRSGDGNWIVLVVDELAAITQAGAAKARAERVRKLGLILAMGRAAGVGVIGCTQRPSAQVLDLDLRDNFRVRVGLGCESLQQTTMIMGDSADKAPCQAIPESLPGGCYVRLDRKVTMARSLLLDPLKVRRIAAQTAQHKGEMAWLKV